MPEQPDDIQIALAHHQAGRLDQAEEIYRRVLARKPDDVDALHLLGVIAGVRGNLNLKEQLLRNAIQVDPNFAEVRSNLGNALRDMGRLDEAIEQFQLAGRLKPSLAEAYYNLGGALREAGRLAESIVAYRAALDSRPEYPEALNNLGNSLRESGRLDDAIERLRRAIEINPNLSEGHNNLGMAYKERREMDKAVECFRAAVNLRPNFPAYHSNLIFAMQFADGISSQAQLAECKAYAKKFDKPRAASQIVKRDRIRVGYISPDLRDHVVGWNVLPLFQNHDRAKFEIFAYANVFKPDEYTDRFEQAADHFSNISKITDAQLVQKIKADGIDILVDLSLHMANNRLPAMAFKPVPIQATFAGYPGGTGLSSIAYRLSDAYLDPSGSSKNYVEKSVRLPKSFWCYDPTAMGAENEVVQPPPATKNKFVTLGCLCNFCKISDASLQLWGGLINDVKDSRLLMLAPAGTARMRVIELLGVSTDRIEFASKMKKAEYLQAYHRIDIALDPLPYNGHVTSLDALWMGVPVVTLAGSTVVGRAGMSILSNLELKELIATTPDQFVKIASELAHNIPKLTELRAGMRKRMLASPLTDAKQFTRDVEAALVEMIKRG